MSVPYDTPKGVKYVSSLLPVGVPASSNTRMYQSINGTTFNNSNNRILIDVQSDGFLDTRQSYLRFKVKNSSGVTLRLDGSAHSLINRLRLEGPNAQELERIDQYNVLAQALLDAQVGEDQCKSSLAALAGTDYDQLMDSSGNYTKYAPVGVTIVSGGSRTFCIPLAASGLLSNDRYVPLPFISGQLRIELILESMVNAFTSLNADAPLFDSVSVENVAFVAQIVNFSDDFMTQFKSVLAQRPIQWHGQTYRRIGSIVAAGTGSANVILNERARSIKSLFSIFRSSSALAKSERKIGGRVYPGGANGTFQYQIKVGGKLYPLQPISVDGNAATINVAESYAELQKALGTLHNITRSSSITPSQWVSTTVSAHDGANITWPNESGKFIMAIDLENFNGEEMESGLNTAANALPIELVLNKGVDPGALQCDTYLLCDVIYTIDASGMITEAH